MVKQWELDKDALGLARSNWYEWFAWYPVTCVDGTRVWYKKTYRQDSVYLEEALVQNIVETTLLY